MTSLNTNGDDERSAEERIEQKAGGKGGQVQFGWQ